MNGPIPGWRGHQALFFAALAFSIVAVLGALRFAGAGPEPSGTYHVQAVVADAQSLTAGGEVRIAGLVVGEIDKIAQRGGNAVVRMAIDGKYAPIRSDARVGVRLRTLVGENYVELYPGDADSPALADNGVLALERQIEQPQIDQILSVLDKPTRENAKRLIRGTGEGVGPRGRDLNRLLGGVNETVEAFAPVATVLDRRRAGTARLIDNLGALMRQVGARGEQLQTLAERSRVTFTGLAARDASLERAFDDLPATLAQVRTTTGILNRVTDTTAPVIEQLTSGVAALEPAIADLGPTATSGRAAALELGRAARPLTTVLNRLRALSAPGADALPKLGEALRQLNPLARYLEPYANDATAFFASMRSAVNYFDATGHAARVHLVVNETSPTIHSQASKAILDALFSSGVLSKVHNLKYSTYQQPGTMDDPSKFGSRKFERVHEDPPLK